MPTYTEPQSRENRLNRVEQATRRLEEQNCQLLLEFADLKQKVEEILERLKDHHDILYGKQGKSGLVHQAEHLEELERALKGYGREPGLIADIKILLEKINAYEDGNKWLTRVIIGAIVVEVVVHLLGLT